MRHNVRRERWDYPRCRSTLDRRVLSKHENNSIVFFFFFCMLSDKICAFMFVCVFFFIFFSSSRFSNQTLLHPLEINVLKMLVVYVNNNQKRGQIESLSKRYSRQTWVMSVNFDNSYMESQWKRFALRHPCSFWFDDEQKKRSPSNIAYIRKSLLENQYVIVTSHIFFVFLSLIAFF